MPFFSEEKKILTLTLGQRRSTDSYAASYSLFSSNSSLSLFVSLFHTLYKSRLEKKERKKEKFCAVMSSFKLEFSIHPEFSGPKAKRNNSGSERQFKGNKNSLQVHKSIYQCPRSIISKQEDIKPPIKRLKRFLKL